MIDCDKKKYIKIGLIILLIFITLILFNNKSTSEKLVDINSDISQIQEYKLKPTNWQCDVNGYKVPVRVNSDGYGECMSTNNVDCLWQSSSVDCNNLIKNTDPNIIKPLTCGLMHKKLYNITGYDTPGHWCNDIYNTIKTDQYNQAEAHKAEADKAADAKAADAKAADAKAADAKAEADKAADAKAADAKAADAKAAADKAEADKAAADKAVADKAVKQEEEQKARQKAEQKAKQESEQESSSNTGLYIGIGVGGGILLIIIIVVIIIIMKKKSKAKTLQ